MNKEEIIKLAQEAGLIRAGENYTEPARWGISEITDFYSRVAAAEREKLAAWMIERGYATGHGDTIKDLLKELEWQIEESVRNEREACAKVCEGRLQHGLNFEGCAAAIRARGETK